MVNDEQQFCPFGICSSTGLVEPCMKVACGWWIEAGAFSVNAKGCCAVKMLGARACVDLENAQEFISKLRDIREQP